MYSTAIQDARLERHVIERIGQSWDTRVAVRQARLDLSQYVDATLPDFPVDMVPFWKDITFAQLDEASKLRFLAAAWVAYNEKAIYLEDEIVQPLCALLMKNRLPGVSDPDVKQVIAQIQVDEQFHILMCLDICNHARERHRLLDYVAPEPRVGAQLHQALHHASNEREWTLIRLAYASVAEMSINAYLNRVATDETIQPLNRINTDMHRRDESAHSMAFRQIVSSIYKALSGQDQKLFQEHIAQALDEFTTPDHSAWESILSYMNIPQRDRIMAELHAASQGVRLKRDYTVLRSLFDDIGIANRFDPEAA